MMMIVLYKYKYMFCSYFVLIFFLIILLIILIVINTDGVQEGRSDRAYM